MTALKTGTTDDHRRADARQPSRAALASFVKDYNAAVTALDGQRGTAGGALAGQSIVNTLSQSLRDRHAAIPAAARSL